jgi:MFS family permease
MLNPFTSLPILRRFIILTIANLCFSIPGEGILATLFVYNQNEFGAGPSMNSIVLASFGAGSVVIQFLIRPMKKQLDDRQLCILGFLIQSVFCVCMGVAWSVYIELGAAIFIGCATVAYAAISAITANGASEVEQGQVQGAFYAIRMIGTGVGPYIFAYTYSVFQDPHGSMPAIPGMPFYLGGAIAFLSVILGYFVPRQTSDHSPLPLSNSMDSLSTKLLTDVSSDPSSDISTASETGFLNPNISRIDVDAYYPPAILSLNEGRPSSIF